MNSYRFTSRALLSAALLLAVFSLTACDLSGQRPTATPTPPPAAAAPYFTCSQFFDADLPPGAAGDHYLTGQAILTGPAEGIAKLFAALGAADEGFHIVQNCTLRYSSPDQSEKLDWQASNSGKRGATPVTSFPPDTRALSLSLLAWPQDKDTEQVISKINGLGQKFGVYADPNYLTGPLADPASPCRVVDDPFEVGGSPFEVGGSPFEVGGSSSGGMGAEAAPEIFWKQWAFRQIGLAADGSGRGNASGKGVVIGVFDTSPYQPGAAASIHDSQLDLDLTLAFPEMLNETTLDNTVAVSMPVNVADHGLFAAGLVRAVAPASDIHLVRVLNDYGCGDLWTLNQAVNQFVGEQLAQSQSDRRPMIISLSLGVHQPKKVTDAGWPAEIVSLDETLRHANDHGALVVAASGNDSYDSTEPLPMHWPADFTYVLGVSGSNTDGNRACYANAGDVTAPGADGISLTESLCMPRAHECTPADADCGLGVISLATQSKTGYRFWVGTSFAAPLVSGQAALLLGNGLDNTQAATCIQRSAAPLSSGGPSIVNIPASLDCNAGE